MSPSQAAPLSVDLTPSRHIALGVLPFGLLVRRHRLPADSGYPAYDRRSAVRRNRTMVAIVVSGTSTTCCHTAPLSN